MRNIYVSCVKCWLRPLRVSKNCLTKKRHVFEARCLLVVPPFGEDYQKIVYNGNVSFHYKVVFNRLGEATEKLNKERFTLRNHIK
jgi:hypothetical protein